MTTYYVEADTGRVRMSDLGYVRPIWRTVTSGSYGRCERAMQHMQSNGVVALMWRRRAGMSLLVGVTVGRAP